MQQQLLEWLCNFWIAKRLFTKLRVLFIEIKNKYPSGGREGRGLKEDKTLSCPLTHPLFRLGQTRATWLSQFKGLNRLGSRGHFYGHHTIAASHNRGHFYRCEFVGLYCLTSSFVLIYSCFFFFFVCAEMRPKNSYFKSLL